MYTNVTNMPFCRDCYVNVAMVVFNGGVVVSAYQRDNYAILSFNGDTQVTLKQQGQLRG